MRKEECLFIANVVQINTTVVEINLEVLQNIHIISYDPVMPPIGIVNAFISVRNTMTRAIYKTNH